MIGHWIAFALIFIAIPFGVAGLKVFASMNLKFAPTEEQNKIANQNAGKYIFFYWLCDLFYMACFNNWIVWQYIFGLLSLVIVFYSLTISFLNSNTKNVILKYGFIQDFIVGIGLSVYLIYIIPNSEIKEIVIPVVSAIYGGLLTLVGVAWTIRKSDKDRKEEKKNSVKPYIYAVSHMSQYNYKEQINLEFVKTKDSKTSHFIGIIQNTDNGVFIIKEAIVNGESYKVFIGTVLDKNKPAQVLVYDEKEINIESMYIVGTDVLGNSIKYKLMLNREKQDIESVVEEE